MPEQDETKRSVSHKSLGGLTIRVATGNAALDMVAGSRPFVEPRELANELSKSGICQFDPLEPCSSKTRLVLQVEMVPFVLPIVGLVLVLAQIVYGDVSQSL